MSGLGVGGVTRSFLVASFVLGSCAGSVTSSSPSPGTATTLLEQVTLTMLTSVVEVADVVESSPPTERPPRAPVVIGIAGDTNFVGDRNGPDPLGAVAEILSAPDLMVVNLETAVADVDVGRPPLAKRFLFKSAPETLDYLLAAGIDAATLANNHTLDYGPDALEQTLDELDNRGILRVGAGLEEASAYSPLIVEVGEWRIGMVSFSRVPCDWSASGEIVRPQVAWVCDPFLDRADAAVRQAQEASDVVIVMVHGGEEGVMCPSPFMITLREHWAEFGVDLVVDSHPHVVQGLRSYDDTLVVNSTGNFAFPAAKSISANSAVFLATVSEDGVSLAVEPVLVPGGVASPATDAQRAEIFDQINRVSDGLRVDESGVVVVDDSWSGSCG